MVNVFDDGGSSKVVTALITSFRYFYYQVVKDLRNLGMDPYQKVRVVMIIPVVLAAVQEDSKQEKKVITHYTLVIMNC